MQINSICSINMQGRRDRSTVNAQNTGVVAAVGLTAAALASMSNNKTLHTSHKYFGVIGLAAMAAHVWLVTAWRRK